MMTLLQRIKWMIAFLLLPIAVYANQNVVVCFTPAENCPQRVVDQVAMAKKKVFIQAYNFSSMKLSKAVIKLHKSGVNIVLLADHRKIQHDNKMKKTVLNLVKQGIPVWTSAQRIKQHNKIIIIDDKLVITGSANFKRKWKSIANNVVFLRNQSNVNKYLTNWQRQLGKATLLKKEPVKNVLTDIPATNTDGSVNVVVEIPAGSNAKWELDKHNGKIKWQIKKGKPRIVNYLPYPANYGFIPRTILPKASGGDGDPLDVLLLSAATKRGTVVAARIIGVLKLLDRGEVDDKLLAVPTTGPFSKIHNFQQLQARYPGVTTIISNWFIHYKGAGKMVSRGFSDEKVANRILEMAKQAFQAKNKV